jgi:hypothetical protein
MVPSHGACGVAAGAALPPVYGWDLLSSHSRQRLGDEKNKVAAGVNPAAKATLVDRIQMGTYRVNPAARVMSVGGYTPPDE